MALVILAVESYVSQASKLVFFLSIKIKCISFSVSRDKCSLSCQVSAPEKLFI